MVGKKKYKIESIPNYLKDYAHDLTMLRLEATKDRYTSSYNKRTGIKESVLLGSVEKDYYTEYVGILGELVTRRHYDVDPDYSGFKVSAYIKSKENVSKDTDLIAYKNGEPIKISIKSGERSFKANKHSMDKEDADIVVFIIFLSADEYLVRTWTTEEVKRFELKGGHSQYYYRNLPQTIRDTYDFNGENNEGVLPRRQSILAFCRKKIRAVLFQQ
jgi:hypothetical protein